MRRLGVCFGGLLLASLAPVAYGNIQISYSTDGGATTVVCANIASNVGPAVCSFSASGVAASIVSASSNSPGTASDAHTFDSTLEITTTSAVTLDVWFAAQDFTRPVTPPALTYSGSTSLTSTQGSGTVTGQHCLDTNNSLTFCSAGSLLNNVPEAFTSVDSNSNTNAMVINSLAASFAMQEHLSMVLAAGSNLNVITSSILTPVPEPMSIALLGASLLLTSVVVRRRRKQSA